MPPWLAHQRNTAMSPYLKGNKTGARHTENIISGEETPDQFRFLGNYPPTPPLSQQFALSGK